MKNICVVVGARPNFVKVAPLIRAIEHSEQGVYTLVYAGCDDDPTLESTLFEDLQMPRPDVFLGVGSSSLNEITSQVMARFDAFLDEHPVDVVIVVDDLASTMAAAIVAKKRGLTLAHLVAGTRSFDMKMPKEVNRLVIDALSDILFTAGVRSNSVATREQAEGSTTYMVGNILMDSLRFCQPRLRKPDIDVEEGKYLVFTINRRALLSDPEKLSQLLQAIVTSAGDTPIIAPLRDEARQAIEHSLLTIDHYAANKVQCSIVNDKRSMVNDKRSMFNGQCSMVNVQSPMSYLEFGWLTAHARGIITDSGNVAEEATFNGVPCITLNSYTEHQETVTQGTNVLVGEDSERLAQAVSQMVGGQWKSGSLPDRWDGRTAERIVKILID
ncbi:MAG: UDP-N-acetylglucosamine 2-epimerase [Prevotella sp.]|nr:UDP-N-acetylglucosamine 2-epimerase [Prevotella sp.]